MRIHCSNDTAQLLKKVGGFQLECRGTLEIKGKGQMTTWWLKGEDKPISSSSRRIVKSGGGSELYSEGAQLRSSSAVLRTPNRVIINIPGTPTQ